MMLGLCTLQTRMISRGMLRFVFSATLPLLVFGCSAKRESRVEKTQVVANEAKDANQRIEANAKPAAGYCATLDILHLEDSSSWCDSSQSACEETRATTMSYWVGEGFKDSVKSTECRPEHTIWCRRNVLQNAWDRFICSPSEEHCKSLVPEPCYELHAWPSDDDLPPLPPSD